MSNLQIIEELCRICEAQSFIIREQAEALEQIGAVVMEEERTDADHALTALIGCGETSICNGAINQAGGYTDKWK